MGKKEVWNILFLCNKKDYDIPSKIDDICLDVRWFSDIETVVEGDIDFLPDFILARDEYSSFRGGDLIFELKRRWESVPLILVTPACSTRLIKEIYDSGGFGYIHENNIKEDLYSIVLKYSHYQQEKRENSFLIENLASLTAHLQEKNAIFKTVMDLITHDTKNVFFYISSLISQMKEKNLKLLLESTIGELNDCLLEAYGYMRSDRRVISAVEMLKGLRLTEKRALLGEVPRIEFSHESKLILFIEVSAIFKNALINIIENALKYSDEDSPVHVSVTKKGSRILFSVADKGKGISDEDKVKIFERFVRLEREVDTNGSGRGLWITKNIIKKERGNVEVVDTPGGGATFLIDIPAFRVGNFQEQVNNLTDWFHLSPLTVSQKETTIRSFLQLQGIGAGGDLDSLVFANLLQLLREEAKAKNQKHFYKKLAELKKLNPAGRSVLVVDDSIHVHYYLASNLTQIGFRIVGFAKNGAEGLSYYNRLKPDLVTLDSTMPIMSGQEAASKILEGNPAAKILFVTGVGGHPKFIEAVSTLLPQKNYRIITKPFQLEDLQNILKDFL